MRAPNGVNTTGHSRSSPGDRAGRPVGQHIGRSRLRLRPFGESRPGEGASPRTDRTRRAQLRLPDVDRPGSSWPGRSRQRVPMAGARLRGARRVADSDYGRRRVRPPPPAPPPPRASGPERGGESGDPKARSVGRAEATGGGRAPGGGAPRTRRGRRARWCAAPIAPEKREKTPARAKPPHPGTGVGNPQPAVRGCGELNPPTRLAHPGGVDSSDFRPPPPPPPQIKDDHPFTPPKQRADVVAHRSIDRHTKRAFDGNDAGTLAHSLRTTLNSPFLALRLHRIPTASVGRRTSRGKRDRSLSG